MAITLSNIGGMWDLVRVGFTAVSTDAVRARAGDSTTDGQDCSPAG